MEFDSLFRKHLINVYAFLGKSIPDELYKPIKRMRPKISFIEPSAMLNVIVDGRITNYFEWLGAGHYSTRSELVAMAHGEKEFIKDIYFGFDESNFFVRIDFGGNGGTRNRISNIPIAVNFTSPKVCRIELNKLDKYAVDDTIEASLSLIDLGFKGEDEIEFFIEHKEEERIRRIPFSFPIRFTFTKKGCDEVSW